MEWSTVAKVRSGRVQSRPLPGAGVDRERDTEPDLPHRVEPSAIHRPGANGEVGKEVLSRERDPDAPGLDPALEGSALGAPVTGRLEQRLQIRHLGTEIQTL